MKLDLEAREMQPDGTYRRIIPENGQETLNSQQWMIENRGIWHQRK